MYAIQKICLFMLLPVIHVHAASSSIELTVTKQTKEVIRVVVPETLGLFASVVTRMQLQGDKQIRAGVALHADKEIARKHATHQLHLSCGPTCKDPALLTGLITLMEDSGQTGGFMLIYRIKSGVTTINPFTASDRDTMFVALGHHEALSSNPTDLYTHFDEEAALRDFLSKERCIGIALNYAALRQK